MLINLVCETRDEFLKSHIGKEEIVNKVDSMHSILRTRLNGGNINTAKQAEEFLNWLIFNENFYELKIIM